MLQGFAELQMYVAPERVPQAQEQWLRRVLARLDVERLDARALELQALWRSSRLLLTQTCGYP
ncbi:MAG TPA: phosphate ABC transporter substrate-binding protein, partial [Pseudomonas sp.]|nr:phosphate ABC transporter substrate-binding protein [Pseudomonas sp.]